MITPPAHEEVFVVGLAGPSGSGKSTVAKRVARRLNGHVISMEIYSIEVNQLPLEERAKQNYDAPNAINVQLLESHIQDYAAGHAIEAPIYDFAQHLRVRDRHEHIAAESLLIVEGILALHFARLRPHFDLSMYLDAPPRGLFPSPKGERHHGASAFLGLHPVAVQKCCIASNASVRASQQELRRSCGE